MTATVLTAALLLFVALPVGLSDDAEFLLELDRAFAMGWVQLPTGDDHVLEVDRRHGFIEAVRFDGRRVPDHRLIEEGGVVTVLDDRGGVRAQAPIDPRDHGRWLATSPLARLGLWFRTEGRTLVLTDVRPDSPAEAGGLRVGDRVVMIDGRPATRRTLTTSLVARIGGGELPIDVERGGQALGLLVTCSSLLPPEQLRGVSDPLGVWIAAAPDAPPTRHHAASRAR